MNLSCQPFVLLPSKACCRISGAAVYPARWRLAITADRSHSRRDTSPKESYSTKPLVTSVGARALVLVAELHRGRPAVSRRLIPDREIRERRAPILERIGALDIERVEAYAQHEEQLLQQHFADGAQLALEAVALAQEARVRIGAA